MVENWLGTEDYDSKAVGLNPTNYDLCLQPQNRTTVGKVFKITTGKVESKPDQDIAR